MVDDSQRRRHRAVRGPDDARRPISCARACGSRPRDACSCSSAASGSARGSAGRSGRWPTRRTGSCSSQAAATLDGLPRAVRPPRGQRARALAGGQRATCTRSTPSPTRSSSPRSYESLPARHLGGRGKRPRDPRDARQRGRELIEDEQRLSDLRGAAEIAARLQAARRRPAAGRAPGLPRASRLCASAGSGWWRATTSSTSAWPRRARRVDEHRSSGSVAAGTVNSRSTAARPGSRERGGEALGPSRSRPERFGERLELALGEVESAARQARSATGSRPSPSRRPGRRTTAPRRSRGRTAPSRSASCGRAARGHRAARSPRPSRSWLKPSSTRTCEPGIGCPSSCARSSPSPISSSSTGASRRRRPPADHSAPCSATSLPA